MEKARPRRPPGKDAFVLDLVDRRTGKRTARGLATSDENEATLIAHDYSGLLDRRDILNNPMKYITDLMAFHPKAIELAFGADHLILVRIREIQNPKVGLTEDDLAEAEGLAREVLIKAIPPPSPWPRSPSTPGSPAAAFDEEMDWDASDKSAMDHHARGLGRTTQAIRASLAGLLPAKLRALAERVGELERENQVLRARGNDLQRELDYLRRRTNAHVTVTLHEACTAFVDTDRFKRLADMTRKEMKRAFELFRAALPDPDAFKLADLRTSHIQNWIDHFTRPDGTAYSARTVAKNRQYVSTILSALYRRYDLAENAVDKLEPGQTPRYDRLGIAAFTRPEDIFEMLDTLGKVDVYWQAALGVAVLAGPRYAELTWLRIGDVDLIQNLISIHGQRDEKGNLIRGTKTGKQRRTPIEQTMLRAILVKYIKHRLSTQRKTDAPEAWRSPWLFPSAVPPNPFLPRTKSLPGQWSSNRTFMNAWQRVAAKAVKITGARDYWELGPREWRHSACTAMGNSGLDAERGSAWVGNSPAVWRAHYCSPSTSGKAWPFRW